MISYSLMSGTGNTFAVVDNRQQILNDIFAFTVEKSKEHHVDGSLIIENSDKADFKMRIINADGTEAEMCGNGARCAAAFAYDQKIVNEPNMIFETLAGLIKGEIKEHQLVKVQLTKPFDLKMQFPVSVPHFTGQAYFINTGVPHTVILTDNVDDIDVYTIGKEIRYSEMFKPAGTNVNFAEIIDSGNIKVRTYERGVENETQACGTGSTASALISALTGQTQSPVTVLTRSSEKLTIYFTYNSENSFHDVFLEGRVSYFQ